jgi:hypothetical protein
MSSSEGTIEENSLDEDTIDNGGLPFVIQDRIITKERIDELEYILERDIKYRERELAVLKAQPSAGLKSARNDSSILKSHTYHYSQ